MSNSSTLVCSLESLEDFESRKEMAQQSLAASEGALSAQLKYLNDGAHLMALAAPGCSAHLMSACNLLMFANDIEQSDTRRRHVCGGCGSIMIPGWTTSVEKERICEQKKKKKRIEKSRKRPIASSSTSTMVYTCERCGCQTPHSINKTTPSRISLRNALQPRPSLAEAADRPGIPSSDPKAQIGTSVAVSANASSKRRAKSRKQGGLQALLAKNKEASQSSGGGFGLDLLDFMK